MKATLHWTSSGYTHLKNGAAAYSFQGTTKEELRAVAAELEAQAKRKLRQAAMIAAYLDGETECSPEAINPR